MADFYLAWRTDEELARRREAIRREWKDAGQGTGKSGTGKGGTGKGSTKKGTARR